MRAPGGVEHGAIEGELREALAAWSVVVDEAQRAGVVAFRAQHALSKLPNDCLPTDLQWLDQQTKKVLQATPPELAVGLVELQIALHVPPPLVALQALSLACAHLAEEPMPYAPQAPTLAALPALLSARARLRAAAQAASTRAC